MRVHEFSLFVANRPSIAHPWASSAAKTASKIRVASQTGDPNRFVLLSRKFHQLYKEKEVRPDRFLPDMKNIGPNWHTIWHTIVHIS